MVAIFVAYRKQNDVWRDRIVAALEELKQIDSGQAFPISVWSDNHILGGDDWEQQIAVSIDASDLFLLLVSSDLNGGYALDVELKRAIRRARAGSCKIVPVVLDNVIAFLAPAGLEEFRFHAIPAGGRGLTQEPFVGDASAWLTAVIDALKRLIEKELGAGQWRELETALIAEELHTSANEVLDAIQEERNTFPAWPRAEFAARRALDLLEIAPESVVAGVVAVKRLVNESRREAVRVAPKVHSALLNLGAQLEDLSDAATAAGFQAYDESNSTEIPSSDPHIRKDLDQLGQQLESTERSAERLRAEGASAARDSDHTFVVSAAERIGAETRLAKAVVSADVFEPALLVATTGQLKETIGAVEGQAIGAGLSEEPLRFIQEAQVSAREAHSTAIGLKALGESLSNGSDAEPTRQRGDIDTQFEKLFETDTYKVFTRDFDQEVNAEELVDPLELPRLKQYLDVQLQGIRSLQIPTTLKRALVDHGDQHAISILIDNSGSMRGRNILTTVMAVTLTGALLNAHRVPFEILGFTTTAWKGGEAKERWLKAGRPSKPGRLNALRHVVYKEFKTPWPKASRNLGLMMREGLLKENIDGEAIIWAAMRLNRHRAPNKSIILLTDGAPVDDATVSVESERYLIKHLDLVTTRLAASTSIDLNVVGVGHDPRSRFPDALFTTDLSDPNKLPELLVTTLTNIFEAEWS